MPDCDLDWSAENVPVSRQYDDPYFAVTDGLAESTHVFLCGNGLPERFERGFHIAELGFGTGLNAIAAWRAWEAAGVGGALRFTSFEAHPMSMDDRFRALARWPELGDHARRLGEALARGSAADLGTLHLEVVGGLAEDTVPAWDGFADAWFLDGFNPAKNPAMWTGDLMAAVARRTKPGGTFATYTAAGHVRRALEAAGFEVERRAGFGTKRHMSVGKL